MAIPVEGSVLEAASKLCLNNSRQYLKDADLLCTFQSWGHALGLILLSEVELGRAVVYHLWSKDLISEEVLPSQFSSYYRERRYSQLAAETWWVGLVIASNIDDLVQNLLNASLEDGEDASAGDLSAPTKQRIVELISKMDKENSNLSEHEDLRKRSFFVDFNLNLAEVFTPIMANRQHVRERLHYAKKRVRNWKPFLSLTLSDGTQKIAKLLFTAAFESALPLRDRISQNIVPLTCEKKSQTTSSRENYGAQE